MIVSELRQWRRIPGLKEHPVWTTAFTWLEQHSALAAEGVHPLGKDGFHAKVMRYPLKERVSARYESHRQTVDIQYTLEGAEGIEFSFAHDLESLHDYSQNDDVEHFATPAQGAAWIDNSKGRFVVFFPGEPHMPQLVTAAARAVHKVVVKVPARLVLAQTSFERSSIATRSRSRAARARDDHPPHCHSEKPRSDRGGKESPSDFGTERVFLLR